MDQLSSSGFVVCEDMLAESLVAELVQHVKTYLVPEAGRGGVRNLLADSRIRDFVGSAPVRSLVNPILGQACFAVRGILFDKTPQANWKVSWHQDVTIAVAEKVDAPGFGPWSVKDGVLHVQPPASVLECMLTVRVHLDPCPGDNGALRVLPGTHLAGKLREAQITELAETIPPVTCEVLMGGFLLMRPLLVHSSSASTRVAHRRVLHFDFASENLPHGLRWAECPMCS